VGRPRGWAQPQSEEEGREEERPIGGTGSGWDPLAGRGGRGCRVGPAAEREEPTDRRAWPRKSKFKTDSNLTISKTGLPGIEKSKIKYVCEVLKEGNNFLHRNFLRFEIYFELKIWEVKV
jgi:hypothetical protein